MNGDATSAVNLRSVSKSVHRLNYLIIILSLAGCYGSGGKAELSWTIPQYRENGDTLYVEEIDGYLIAYKVDDEPYTLVMSEGGTVNSMKFSRLEPGLWTFRVKTIDTNGLESNWSDTAEKLIQNIKGDEDGRMDSTNR